MNGLGKYHVVFTDKFSQIHLKPVPKNFQDFPTANAGRPICHSVVGRALGGLVLPPVLWLLGL
jgi:hypothetical protein